MRLYSGIARLICCSGIKSSLVDSMQTVIYSTPHFRQNIHLLIGGNASLFILTLA